jgi:hypothetical protein
MASFASSWPAGVTNGVRDRGHRTRKQTRETAGAAHDREVTARLVPVLIVCFFVVYRFGIFGCLPVFWTLPAAFLSGAAAEHVPDRTTASAPGGR